MCVAEPPAHALINLVQLVGPINAAQHVLDGTAPPAVVAETVAHTANDSVAVISDQFAAADAVGARLVIPEDAEWPADALRPLAKLHVDPHRHGVPLGLWVRGSANLNHLLVRAISIIGSSAATEYGNHVAAEFGHDLARLGAVVVAGTSLGIDAAAHRGAHAALGSTIAVLVNGIAVTHPRSNGPLIDQVADGGLVISEYAPTTQPARHRVRAKNRLIAGMASGLVVVEAGFRSGFRDAAAMASALGKAVMAVPGRSPRRCRMVATSCSVPDRQSWLAGLSTCGRPAASPPKVPERGDRIGPPCTKVRPGWVSSGGRHTACAGMPMTPKRSTPAAGSLRDCR